MSRSQITRFFHPGIRVWILAGIVVASLQVRILAASQEFQQGFFNFYSVLRQIDTRYEDPNFDKHALLAMSLTYLQQAVKVESATEPIPFTSQDISAATDALVNIESDELIERIGAIIAAEDKKARESIDSVSEATTTANLWNAALIGLVDGLGDEYSKYLPPEGVTQLNKFLQAEPDPEQVFYGVGIHVDWDLVGDQGVLVLAPIPDGPAYLNDIRAGDIIIAVDGEPIENDQEPEKDLLRAIDRIKGPKDSLVQLTIRREGTPYPIMKSLRRAPVDPNIQYVKYMVDDEKGVGYLRLVTFNQHSAHDVEEALIWLKTKGMKKLIFDLRFNPGGYLDQAVEVADLFVPKGQLITYTQGRDPAERIDFIDQRDSEYGFEDIDLVILINEYSASASEVVTGALKDSGRCQVIGMKSFGKGSVQEVFPLEGDAALRLTVAKYYTPANRCIHKIGIEPDYIVQNRQMAQALAEVSGGVESPTETAAAGESVSEASSTSSSVQSPHHDDVQTADEDLAPSEAVYHSRLEKLLSEDAQFKKAYEVLVRRDDTTGDVKSVAVE